MISPGKNIQPWLHSGRFDLPFILLPGFVALAITLCLPAEYKLTDRSSLAGWVILVIFIDVAHVYSTLFRTYWDKGRMAKHRTLYIAVPVACYIAGVLLYSADALFFWRILAYLAVFHFVRQQYGFMRLYARHEQKEGLAAKIDAVTIYAATLYPLIYWHFTPQRNFTWFVEGDFILSNSAVVKQIALAIYLLIIATYVLKEIVVATTQKKINIPKNILIAVTLVSWYFGIVWYNGDMAFTLLNVVAHGIPYMALVWLMRRKEVNSITSNSKRTFRHTLVFFVLSILLFAYLEEGLWDGLVWREHQQVFTAFTWLPTMRTKEALALLVPLLSLPQSTHYVLDGFIWKKEKAV
ncbi:MAG: hypothetical protein V4649_19895 [Bacteroidota bacterium]